MVPFGPGRPDPQILDRLGALAILRRETDDDREMPVAAGFVEIAGAVAADRHLDGGIDVAGRQPVAGGLGAVDVDLDGGLAERGEHRQIGDALHGGKHRLDLVGGIGQRLQIVAVELDRVLALHAGHRFGNVVLQVLREVELDAGKFVLQLLRELRGQLLLVVRARPLADRLQRREELGVEQPGGVGAVVGAAMLRHHRLPPRAGCGSACASR